MNTFRIGVVACLIFLCSGALSADNELENGYWWGGKSGDAKVFWVGGFVSAMERANLLIRDNESVMKTKLMDKVANTSLAAAFDFYGVTYGQYVEGLDVFY